MEQSDGQLLRQARAGDKQALSELLLRHGPDIRAGLHINPKWRSMLEADDVMQITYFEAFEQISQFTGEAGAFGAWLRRIALNNLRDAIDWLQREKRPQPEKRVTAPQSGDTIAWLCAQLTGEGESPSHHAVSNEMRRLLEAEIDTLPEDYANVLRWIFLEEKSVGEVARRLGKTSGAVHLLRIRAVSRLRQQMGSGSAFLSFYR